MTYQLADGTTTVSFVRPAHGLVALHGTVTQDVLDLLEKGETAVMSIRNFGEKSLDELRQKMQEKGFMKDNTTET